jgi:hypothetical protein
MFKRMVAKITDGKNKKRKASKKEKPKRGLMFLLSGLSKKEKFWPPESMSAEDFYDRGWRAFTRGE